MAKKINVSSLLKSAMNDDINPGETLKSLKAQRNKETVPVINPGNSERNGNSVELSDSSKPNYQHTEVTKEHPKIIGLEDQQCFDDYEELTRTVNYKLHKKLSRNDIMRKVLEHYHTNELEDLLRLLHTI